MLISVGKKSEQRKREDLMSRRVIDIAIGVLMGLRRCSEKDAFDDLANAVHETGVGLSVLARALIDLVGNGENSFPHRAEAVHMWGHLLAHHLAEAHNQA